MSCRPLLRNVARQVGVLQLELQQALLAYAKALKMQFRHVSWLQNPHLPRSTPSLSLPNIIRVYADYTLSVRLSLHHFTPANAVSDQSKHIQRPLGLYVSA